MKPVNIIFRPVRLSSWNEEQHASPSRMNLVIRKTMDLIADLRAHRRVDSVK